MRQFIEQIKEILPLSVWEVMIKIIFILIISFVALKLISLITRRFNERESKITSEEFERIEQFKRLKTLVSLGATVLKILVFFIMVTTLLGEFGIDIKPLLAGAGIAGLAVGFGAQSLVKDFISGAFVLVEDQFRVGDIIKVAGDIAGVVEKMTMRVTVLRDLQGQVHFVPNGNLGVVTNMTRDYSTAVIDVSFAYEENIDSVVGAIRDISTGLEADDNFKRDFIEPIQVLGVEQLADFDIKVRCLLKVQPGKHWAISREFKKRIKNRFDELGIEIPIPFKTAFPSSMTKS